jgi:hypothetical protein
METVLEKLRHLSDTEPWHDWSREETRQLLEVYGLLCQKEAQLFDLVYSYHGCDGWEDIFRDYDPTYLKDKAMGVEMALREITERMGENRSEKEEEEEKT